MDDDRVDVYDNTPTTRAHACSLDGRQVVTRAEDTQPWVDRVCAGKEFDRDRGPDHGPRRQGPGPRSLSLGTRTRRSAMMSSTQILAPSGLGPHLPAYSAAPEAAAAVPIRVEARAGGGSSSG